MQDSELELAARVHYSFLPTSYRDDFVDIAVNVRPAGRIGGDYCSIYPVSQNRLVICMCDAVGHGIASALFAARINTFVLRHAPSVPQPCELIESLNEFLCRSLTGTGMYSTFFAMYLDSDSGVLDYAGAAHPPALHYDARTEEIRRYDSETTLLGVAHPLPLACSVNHRRLGAGDRVVIYTDGLIEARDAARRRFGIDRLEQSLVRHCGLDGHAFNERLISELLAFCGGPPGDDILIMTLSARS